MPDGVPIIGPLVGIICIILGIFFALRSIYRFKEWRTGDKDELWMFLSLVIGAGGLFFIGVPSTLVMMIGFEWVDLTFIGLMLGLLAVGLTTYYYFQKWKSQK